jgi:hypothetical protein
MIKFDGTKETIIPEPEPGADVMLFSYLPGLSRITSRVIPESPFTQTDSSSKQPQKASQRDKAYYQRRAEEELDLAQKAQDERAVRSHYQLAAHYLDLVHHERLTEEG